MNLSKVGTEGIFHISDLSRFYTVVRLDVLESILKRGVRGIKVTQMETEPADRRND